MEFNDPFHLDEHCSQ